MADLHETTEENEPIQPIIFDPALLPVERPEDKKIMENMMELIANFGGKTNARKDVL